MAIENIIERQRAINDDDQPTIESPRYSIYSVCNLRGGCGKTTLSFNISWLAKKILSVDLCPQGNLSYFYDNAYFTKKQTNVYDLIVSHLVPDMGYASNSGINVGATNPFFQDRKCFYIPSSDNLYLLSSMINSSVNISWNLPGEAKTRRIQNIFNSVRTEVKKEMKTLDIKRCLMDTSPFLSGGTELALYASDALIVPVRTDQQSINSFELLLDTMSNPNSSFTKYIEDFGLNRPKIHMVVLTHGGWSTKAGSINKPNQQTMMYLKKVYEIISRRISMFSTDNTDNHLMIFDDLLGTGRISSAFSKPVELLSAGESKNIDRVKVCVNRSVEKCKNQLRFINSLLWEN